MSEKHPREEAIFEGALPLSPEQREAYLKAACGGDGTLLERIRDLIWFHEKGDGPLETPAVHPPLKATIVPSLMTLSATRRRTGCSCSAMKTEPQPPSPMSWRIL